MKRSLIVLCAALALAACENKPAEAPATPAPATNAAPAAADAPKEAPEAPAESAGGEHGHHDHGDTKQAAAMPEDLKPGEQGYFGQKFTIIEEPVTLAAAIAAASDQPVKVEATVKAVCKKKGCWFTMTGDGVTDDVRVKMKDYSFFVPKNVEGARVVAEGTLTQREIPQDEAQHYADDAAKPGEEPKKVEGPQKAWEFTATAIEMKAAES